MKTIEYLPKQSGQNTDSNIYNAILQKKYFWQNNFSPPHRHTSLSINKQTKDLSAGHAAPCHQERGTV